MAKSGLLIFFLAAAPLAFPQAFDNTGNHLLNGGYYFREVVFTSKADVALYGSITFDGNGSYSISGKAYDDSSLVTQSYTSTGTYKISAGGLGFLSNQLLSTLGATNAVTHGLVANHIFVGSSTESGINDIFIAAPIASQSTGTLQGAYSLTYMSPVDYSQGGGTPPFDGLLTMSSNGSGGIGNVGVSAYSTSSTATTQTISGVKYFASNNAFVVEFPSSTNSSALIQGNEYLYSSPDGSFVFGGAPNNIDMILGVQTGSSGSNFGGLYYQAGLDEDLSQFANGSYTLDTYYGSFNASNGVEVGHKRVLGFGGSPTGFTYGDLSTQSSNGTFDDTFTGQNYIGGNGGAIQIGYGIGPQIALTV
ncbi:MAG TPA: hypothetical protein VJX67_25415, partial [Blastocatellia bacterium]|nr:hypothetical protein [Blastocatellia bacterium]